ncbi:MULTISPECIES: helix-turn-helix domain-containing protein [unclassified Amycolatopsis]|uniref:helix-turn-helix domain-containing protein n=1 Tax=unclassified Amycolatopsis TaxID=2618356 RepID=UPI002E223C57|nr:MULTISPECIES: helix-turn-helix transcriptional regulator [unclassified Amycolatopsis]
MTVNDEEQECLAARLRGCRERLGLTQRAVADRLGVPRSAISGIEAGTRKVDSLELKALAGLYRRPVGYFLEEPAGHPSEPARLLRLYQCLAAADRTRLVEYAELLEIARTARRARTATPFTGR